MFAVVGTVVLVVTAARIEQLNHLAGNLLPHAVEFRDDGSLVTWRVSSAPSTPREATESALRSVVSTWGLAQYPLALAVIVSAAVSRAINPQHRSRPRLILCALAVVIAFASLWLANSRGYFSSLGW